MTNLPYTIYPPFPGEAQQEALPVPQQVTVPNNTPNSGEVRTIKNGGERFISHHVFSTIFLLIILGATFTAKSPYSYTPGSDLFILKFMTFIATIGMYYLIKKFTTKGTIMSILGSGFGIFFLFSISEVPALFKLAILGLYGATAYFAFLGRKNFGESSPYLYKEVVAPRNVKLKDRSNKNLPDINTTMVPVWGVAGKEIGQKFGENGRLGALGEKAVGRVLNDLQKRHPHVRVFHSLNFTPGKGGDTADLDHVVIIDNQAIFIDAKHWGYGTYSWSDRSEVAFQKENGQSENRHVGIADCIDKYIPYLPQGARVQGFITLAQDQGNRYRINNYRSPNTVKMNTLEELKKYLETEASTSRKNLDRRMLPIFLNNMK